MVYCILLNLQAEKLLRLTQTGPKTIIFNLQLFRDLSIQVVFGFRMMEKLCLYVIKPTE